jgi:hypothetical protein
MDEICSGRIYRKNCHDCGQGIQFSGQVSGSRPQFSVPVRGKPVVRRDLAVFENSPMSSPFVEATATQAAQAGIPISKEIQVFKYPDVQFISYTAQELFKYCLNKCGTAILLDIVISG